jgi:hypothetical protein
MKNALLFFLMLLLVGACRKDESGNNIRIKRVSADPSMKSYLYNFDYNSGGQLIKISSPEPEANFVTEIEYDADGLPVKLTRTDYYMGEVTDIRKRTISWSADRFTVSNDVNGEKSVHLMDGEGMITSRISVITRARGKNRI